MSNHSDRPVISLPAMEGKSDRSESGSERRVVTRYPFTAAAEVIEVGSQARVTGRSSDLGGGGCYIDTLSPFRVGSLVRVRLVRDVDEFEADAVVVYAHLSMGMGLSFANVQPKDQVILRKWLFQLRGDSSPEPETIPAGLELDRLAEIVNLRLLLLDMVSLLVRKRVITEKDASVLLGNHSR